MMKDKTTAKSYIDDNDEALPLDKDFFAKAKNGIPDLPPFAKMRRGRPELSEDQRKQKVSIMLDPDLIRHFKKDGKGWQTRVNAALRKVAGL
ncbi:BrnA antitoxin family protein [Alphaproteobacteria bacterium]|nr:BrnA antitoxin family protein [Alphaproteobacteria bacterium]